VSLGKRIQKIEQALFNKDTLELIVYGPKLDSDDYIRKYCNGQETRLTIAEFEAEEAASRKHGNTWITVGGSSDGN